MGDGYGVIEREMQKKQQLFLRRYMQHTNFKITKWFEIAKKIIKNNKKKKLKG